MVNVKAFILVPVTLMTTAAMAQSSVFPASAEMEASASVALADMAFDAEIPLNVVIEKMETLDNYKAAASFDNLGDFITSVANLGYILDLNTRNGVQCSAENRNTINSATSCEAADDLTGFANSLLWPLAIRGFKDTAEKINAQASCLKKILTGQ